MPRRPISRRVSSARPARRTALVLAAALVPASAPALAAPVTFNTALPVSAGHAVGREQVILAEAELDDDRIEELQSVTVLGYGVTPDLALFVAVPWIDRDFTAAGQATREASGLGDLRAFARYTLLRQDMQGGTLRLAPFVGIELPTGETREGDVAGLLPPPLQPGSGSTDFFGGAVASWASVDWNFDAQIALQENRRDGGFAAGDVFQADLAVQKRLLPATLDAATGAFLFGGLELNYRDEGRARIGGVVDPATGARRLFVAPTLQYARKRWIAEAAIQIPVTQDLDGPNFSQDFVLRLGLRVNI